MGQGDDRIDASRPARGQGEGIYETACSLFPKFYESWSFGAWSKVLLDIASSSLLED